MPTDALGNDRVHRVDGGLVDNANPLLIDEGQAAEHTGLQVNHSSAEEQRGARKMNLRRPRKAGVRFAPTIRQSSALTMTRWRDAHAFAPLTQRLKTNPKQMDLHFRIEEPSVYPENGRTGATLVSNGITGRWDSSSSSVVGTPRPGGEHRFYPLLAQGAREIEQPLWAVGIGIVHPEGFRDDANAQKKAPDSISPVFAWWDPTEGRVRVAAADVLLKSGIDYSITLDLPAAAWKVNGAIVPSQVGNGLSPLPAAIPTTPLYPYYAGRCYTREPGIKWDPAIGYDRKHVYLGKFTMQVTGVAAAVVSIANQNLATTTAGTKPYQDYMLRVVGPVTTPSYGRVFRVAQANNIANDVTISFTLGNAAHGVLNGDIVDLVPMMEPVPADVTIQEYRLWSDEIESGAAVLREGATDLHSPDWIDNQLVAAAGADLSKLIAYWPFNDDGGLHADDLVAGSDFFFAPSLLATNTDHDARTLWLDGDTQAIRADLRRDPNLLLNYASNLGNGRNGESHWNLAIRLRFAIGGVADQPTGGTLYTAPYQVLMSLGDPVTKTIALEMRAAYFAGALQIYAALPDGTFQTIAVTLQSGVWYNAVMGIEALANDAAAPNLHYVYLQMVDSSLQVSGGFSAGFSLTWPLDVTKIAVLHFGASVAGTDNLGCNAQNFTMLGITDLGYGFHPIHVVPLTAPRTNPTTALQFLGDLVRLNLNPRSEDMAPTVSGRAGGASLTPGSRVVSVVSGDALPVSLRRWPLRIEHVDLLQTNAGEADVQVPSALIVESVAGSSLTLLRAYEGAPLIGAELRVQLWTGYTRFKTIEPAGDTDLNTGRATGEQWAITPDVFEDLAESAAGFRMAIDPGYEFVSPFLTAPKWDNGIVLSVDPTIAGLASYHRSDDSNFPLAVVGGTLFEFDERWRKGNAWGPQYASFYFRRGSAAKAAQDRARRTGAPVYSTPDSCLPLEAVRSPYFVVPVEVPDGSFIEADINLDALDGRRTIVGNMQSALVADFLGNPSLSYAKNIQFAIIDGKPSFEIGGGAGPGAFIIGDGSRLVAAREWTRVQAQLTVVGLNITAVTLRIDGKAIGTISTGLPLARANVPQLPFGYIGACGSDVAPGTAFVDALGGRMGGIRADFGANVDYQPTPIDGTSKAVEIPMRDGVGYRLVQTPNHDFADFIGHHFVHVGSGMGRSTAGQVSIEIFNDRAYVSNFVTRPWVYDGDELVPAGIRAPAVTATAVVPYSLPLRAKAAGADVPNPPSNASTVVTFGAAPHVRTFTPATDLSQGDVGCLIYIPADPDMGAAGNDPPGIIAVVSAVTPAGTIGYTLFPPVLTEQILGANACSWMLFRAGRITGAIASTSFLSALFAIPVTTPWSAKRLLCNGMGNNPAPVKEDLTTLDALDSCLAFRGMHVVEIPPFTPATVGMVSIPVRDTVFSIKGYIRLDDALIFGDAESVIAESAIDSTRGAWRLVIFQNGRLRFEFWDSLIAGFRSISTVGRVITPKQWFYVHFRYKFKGAGTSVFDTVGGWEADLRWLRPTTGIAISKSNKYRDMLLVYACEGLHQQFTGGLNATINDIPEGAPCPLLTLPGSESQLGATIAFGAALTNNHSQHLLNCGLLLAAPYLTPEKGDTLYAANGPAGALSGIALTIVANNLQNLFVAGALQVGVANFTLPAGFVLPRSTSMNRDDSWNRQADQSNIDISSMCCLKTAAGTLRNYFNSTSPAYPNTNPLYTPNLVSRALGSGATTYGKQDAWAVLVRVFTVSDNTAQPAIANGAVVDHAVGDGARVLVLVHLNENDLGIASRGGTPGHGIFLTDDPLYGGDGLGTLKVGGVALLANVKVFATIELPNGLNQSVNSTNRQVCPSLLVHGTNPVGVGDSPDAAAAPVRFGGSRDQSDPAALTKPLHGRLATWGWLMTAVVTDAANVYTTDCLPPDAFFTGPKDTRIQSLPRLAWNFNLLILDNASGTVCLKPTAVFYFDRITGNVVPKVDANSDTSVPAGLIVRNGDVLQLAGTHRIRLTYADPKRVVESNPGPEFVIVVPGGKDGDDLVAESSFKVSGLPISGDTRLGLVRKLYKTLADGGIPLEWVTIGDNTTTSLVPRPDDVDLAEGSPVGFDRARPPICRGMRASETNMFFAGIDDAPNVIAFSNAFRPEEVPGTQILQGESGRGGGLLGISAVGGFMVAAKRSAIFSITPSGANLTIQRMAQGPGSLSQNGFAELVDGRLCFPGEQGAYQFTGNQKPTEISTAILRLWREGLDLVGMARSTAIAHRLRACIVFAVNRVGDRECRTLLAAEMRFDQFGNPYYVWIVFEPGVPTQALATQEDPMTNLPRALAASRGTLLEWDDVGAKGIGLSRSAATDGTTVGVVTVGNTDGLYAIGGQSLAALTPVAEALAGATVMIVEEYDKLGNWVDPVGGGVGESFAIVAQGEIVDAVNTNTAPYLWQLHVARPLDATPYVGRLIVIGGMSYAYRSRWFENLGAEAVTTYKYLDLYFDAVDGGVAFLTLYQDFGTAAVRVYRVPLGRGMFSVPIQNVAARVLQFRIAGYGQRVGFVLHKYLLRGDETEWGKRQQK